MQYSKRRLVLLRALYVLEAFLYLCVFVGLLVVVITSYFGTNVLMSKEAADWLWLVIAREWWSVALYIVIGLALLCASIYSFLASLDPQKRPSLLMRWL